MKEKLENNEFKVFENNNNLINVLKKTVEKEKNEFVKKIEAEVNELTDQIVNVVESKNILWRGGSQEVNESSPDKHIK